MCDLQKIQNKLSGAQENTNEFSYILLVIFSYFFLSSYGYLILFMDISDCMYSWMLSFCIYITACVHIY
jgi:hypothetical protein